jgi:hypothetical protein
MEYHRQRLEWLLNHLTHTAERWAASGRRLHEQLPVRREIMLRRLHQQRAA